MSELQREIITMNSAATLAVPQALGGRVGWFHDYVFALSSRKNVIVNFDDTLW